MSPDARRQPLPAHAAISNRPTARPQRGGRRSAAAARAPDCYRLLFDHAPVALFEVDLGGDVPSIRSANERAERLYRCAGGGLVGRPLDELFADGSAERLAGLVDAARRGRTIASTAGQVRDDGEAFTARLQLLAAPERTGAEAILVVEDLTGERRRQDDLEAIDRDRRRMAHEIHDGLAQNLYALRLRAARWNALLDEDPERLRAELDEMLADLKDDIFEARRAIFALRPVRLDEAGLEHALRDLAAEAGEQYGFAVAVDISGVAGDVVACWELPLLRIVQEALNNAGRHARATHVAVRLEVRPTHGVTLVVGDDGVGFEAASPGQPDAPGRYGLRQMRERVQAFGGTHAIVSVPGHGTEVRVHLPTSAGAA